MVTVVVLLVFIGSICRPSSFNAKWNKFSSVGPGLVALALAAVGSVFPLTAGPRVFADRIDHLTLLCSSGVVRMGAGAAPIPEGAGVCAGTGKGAAAGEWLARAPSWGWKSEGAVNRESIASHLMELAGPGKPSVIVAMPTGEELFPVNELPLRLRGENRRCDFVAGEISGRIEVEQLNPSWLLLRTDFDRAGFHCYGG
jgi:hypothetical protein